MLVSILAALGIVWVLVSIAYTVGYERGAMWGIHETRRRKL